MTANGERSPRSARGVICLVVVVLVVLVAPGSVRATIYIMATDEELLDRSEVVVLGRVTGRTAQPASGRPRTTIDVEVESVLKGSVAASALLLEMPGGVSPDGRILRAWGVPRFAEGESTLLFLNSTAPGSYVLSDLVLGAFRTVALNGVNLLVRDLGRAASLRKANDPHSALRARSHLPRNLERFAQWIRARADGFQTSADYFLDVPPSGLRALAPKFKPMDGSLCGNPAIPYVRVGQFDSGGRLALSSHESGMPGFADGGTSQVRSGMNAWNRDTGSLVNLRYTGLTSVSNSALFFDGANTILWEDPQGDIPGSFQGGGVVAVAWTAFDCAKSHDFFSGKAYDIVEVDIVLQDGLANWMSGSKSLLSEVLAHELGHCIGIGHSEDANALMRNLLHNDGRGASLSRDDRAAVRFLYSKDIGNRPEPPSDLAAVARSTSEIGLSWTDNANDEVGYEVEQRTVNGEWTTLQSLPANTNEASVTGLPPLSYRVYRARTRNASGFSVYSNEAAATTHTLPHTCINESVALCLSEGRFRVSATFRNQLGGSGRAKAKRLTGDTGYFTFLNESNVEVVTKVLDACGGFDRFWVFAAGLTNVEVVLVVEDTETGRARTYVNPLGTPFPPIQDVGAFATCTDQGTLGTQRASSAPAAADSTRASEVRVYVDPATGHLTDHPTTAQVEELDRLVREQQALQTRAPLSVFPLSDGGVGARLDDRFHSSLRLELDAEGGWRHSCRDSRSLDSPSMTTIPVHETATDARGNPIQ